MNIFLTRQFFPAATLGFMSLCSAATVFANSTENPVVVGDAYDIKNQALLYREVHCGSDSDLEHTVFYQSVDGELMAQKNLNYKTGLFSPSYIQNNLHTDEVISVQLADQTITMSVQDLRKQQPVETYSEIAKDNLPLVIDAGFDGFVRQNWNSLMAGDRKWFRFPLATRASLITFRLEKTDCSYDSNSDQCFRLELSSWLYRMLADPIELGYNPVHKRLTRFRGLSNIEDDKRQGQIVDIHYRYKDVDAFSCGANDMPPVKKT